jgi:hypothetical protein
VVLLRSRRAAVKHVAYPLSAPEARVPCPYDMDAAFTSFERHERGIHAVSTGGEQISLVTAMYQQRSSTKGNVQRARAVRTRSTRVASTPYAWYGQCRSDGSPFLVPPNASPGQQAR